MLFDKNNPYTGPTGLHFTAGVQLYCVGHRGGDGDTPEKSNDDASLSRLIAETGLTPRTVRLSGNGPDFILFLQVGNGSPCALSEAMEKPDVAIPLARNLKRILDSAHQTGYMGWRVAEESAAVACVAHFYEHVSSGSAVYVRDILVTTLAQEPSHATPVPLASFIVLLPDLTAQCTRMFRADSRLEVEYLGAASGLSDVANYHFFEQKHGNAWRAPTQYRYRDRPSEDRATIRERVLREIFFPEAESGGPLNELEFSPSHEALGLFADLLATDPAEEELQQFLSAYPGFLIGLCGFADSSELAFLTKPKIGPDYIADFAILGASQGGAGMMLVEIEPSSAKLFTQKLTPAQRYQAAIGQVTEWGEWIERNRSTFVSDMVRLARSAPMWPNRAPNGSFRRLPGNRLEHMFWAFGGYDMPSFWYTIICGRWAQLQKEERDRLVFLNSKVHKFSTYTYDQLARQAFQRPITHW